jgi:hypothetical protein
LGKNSLNHDPIRLKLIEQRSDSLLKGVQPLWRVPISGGGEYRDRHHHHIAGSRIINHADSKACQPGVNAENPHGT